MARSFSNLWPKIVTWENMVAAYRACRRRKRYKPCAAEFDYAWESNLLDLKRELDEGTYRPGEYRHFRIVHPKPRKISAAPFRDRVVHHALVRVLEPIFERRFIFDSYACRKGKGTHLAIERAGHYLRRYDFFLKTDIVRFFPNVDHAVLLERLQRSIRDKRVMELIRLVIASGEGVLNEEASHEFFPGDDLFALSRPKGLPIGNLTSQFFANVLLDHVDHFVKEELRVPGYVRYADDFVLFDNDKDRLWEYRDRVAAQLEGLRLRLHPKKTHVAAHSAGLQFLGFVHRRSGRRLQQQAIKRFNRRLREMRWLFNSQRITAAKIGESLRAMEAHASWGNAIGIRRVLRKRAKFTRPNPRPSSRQSPQQVPPQGPPKDPTETPRQKPSE